MHFTNIKNLIDGIKYSQNDYIMSNEFNILPCVPDISKKGNLSVITSRPGIGKTTFMLQIAICYAYFRKKPCYVISPEISAEEIAKRIFDMIPNTEILCNLPILVCDTKSINIEEIKAMTKEDIKDGILFIDSCQQIKICNTILKLKKTSETETFPIVFLADFIFSDKEYFIGTNNISSEEFPYDKYVNNTILLYREPYFNFNSIDYYHYYPDNFAYNPEKYYDSKNTEITIAKSTDGVVGRSILVWNTERRCYQGICYQAGFLR